MQIIYTKSKNYFLEINFLIFSDDIIKSLIMQSKEKTPDVYIESLHQDGEKVRTGLRKAIKSNLPKGFKEQMGYKDHFRKVKGNFFFNFLIPAPLPLLPL